MRSEGHPRPVLTDLSEAKLVRVILPQTQDHAATGPAVIDILRPLLDPPTPAVVEVRNFRVEHRVLL